jgi:hypothetical protein
VSFPKLEFGLNTFPLQNESISSVHKHSAKIELGLRRHEEAKGLACSASPPEGCMKIRNTLQLQGTVQWGGGGKNNDTSDPKPH